MARDTAGAVGGVPASSGGPPITAVEQRGIEQGLRRNRYDDEALLDERGGRYYRHGGIHWPGVIALAGGMVAAALWLNAYPPYVSALSSRLGESDFSVFLGLLVGGALYWLLARNEVRAEAEPARF